MTKIKNQKFLYGKMTSKNTALLVIDIVNGCCHKQSEDLKEGITFSKIRKMIPRLERFIAQYRQVFGGLICFAKITPWTKKYLTGNINELYADPKACYYSDDKSGFSEQFYQVQPQK
ncbi:hypothetical protein FJ208_02195, partial [Candidatus Gribaldobacteria bacterium]|nr:hypothetical protein [Candidatus Gribaldobacteria bacterium]